MEIEEIAQRFGRTLKSYVGTGMSIGECDNFVRNVLQSQQSRIEELEKDKLFFSEQWEAVSKENTELKKIIKEAINLPKGVEPHSYSDLKNKR